MCDGRVLENHESGGWVFFFFFFLNGLEMEIGILSWQRSQPLDSDLKLYMRKSLRGTDKKCKVNSVRMY